MYEEKSQSRKFWPGSAYQMLPPNSNFKSIDGQFLFLKLKYNMRTLWSFIIVAMVAFTSSCGQAQNNMSSNTQAENMLLEFYTKHFEVWRIPSLAFDVIHKFKAQLTQKIEVKEEQELIKQGNKVTVTYCKK
jgi:hypothetical protein